MLISFQTKAGDPTKESGPIASATEMALVHNIIIRGLNCIYLQAPNVKLEKDIADFLQYMFCWSELIHEHHGNEEAYFFPWLEEDIGIKGYMEKNVEQHHAFGPGLKAFDNFVTGVREGTENYDGVKVRQIIDSFGTVLTDHLKDEITSFEDLEKLGEKIDWPRWIKRVQEHAVGTAKKVFDPTQSKWSSRLTRYQDTEIPFLMTNADLSFEKPIHDAVWLPLPWYVAMMFRWFYVPKYKGAWRFSCCDSHSLPKELEFV